jgi:hypothetical protein
MKSSFENLYGYLFRNYAKSIIESAVLNDIAERPELITIGIYQFHPFDSAFYYAPTIKDIFKMPYEITEENFPTSNTQLWNKELIVKLGKFLVVKKNTKWIELIIKENEEIESLHGSTYAITFGNYRNYRKEWLLWYKQNISTFEIINTPYMRDHNILINQLFYFANFLITIIKRPAFTNLTANNLSNAESIFRCICNRPHVENVANAFDKNYGDLKGFNIPWSAEIIGREKRALLIYVLEICLRQPFNIETKIDLIEHATLHKSKEMNYKIDAIGVPLLHNGEFLGISYVTWSSNKKNIDKKKQETIESTLKEILNGSRLGNFLYRARMSTSRTLLQKTLNYSSIEKQPIQRVFEHSYIFSSAFLVIFINNDKVFAQFKYKHGNDIKTKTVEIQATSQKLMKFLEENTKYNGKDLLKKQVKWIDIIDNKEIKDNSVEKLFPQLKSFDKELKNIINDVDFTTNDFYYITHATIHTLGNRSEQNTLIFFNSNFRIFYGYYRSSASSILKQSYATEFHKNLTEMIEDEETHRRLFKESQIFQEELKKGLIHSFKSYLDSKIKMVTNYSIPCEQKINAIRSNSQTIVDRMNKFLKAYGIKSIGETISIRHIAELWNSKREEIGKLDKLIIRRFDLRKASNIEIIGCAESVEMILDEIITNASKAIQELEDTSIELKLSINNFSDYIQFNIENSGSTIATSHRSKIGKNPITDSKSAGLGFLICDILLYRMRAEPIEKRHFNLLFNDDDVSFIFSFNLKTN